jgi:hypothetical protein
MILDTLPSKVRILLPSSALPRDKVNSSLSSRSVRGASGASSCRLRLAGAAAALAKDEGFTASPRGAMKKQREMNNKPELKHRWRNALAHTSA